MVEFEPITDLLRMVGAGLVGGLVSILFSHFLTISRERRSRIQTEQLKFIPAIEELIESTKNCGGSRAEVRARIRPDLYESALRFRQLLKGRRLQAFNAAWQTLLHTTAEEAPYQQPDMSDAEFERLRQNLSRRFQAVLEIVRQV